MKQLSLSFPTKSTRKVAVKAVENISNDKLKIDDFPKVKKRTLKLVDDDSDEAGSGEVSAQPSPPQSPAHSPISNISNHAELSDPEGVVVF